MFLSDERPTLETLDFTIRVGSTPTFSVYFDLCLNTAYAAHYVYYRIYLLANFSYLLKQRRTAAKQLIWNNLF